jgi:hypothetical protein
MGMSYQLILSEPVDEGKKDIGENVFFEGIPVEYKVYLFYYPSVMPNEDLENKLRKLGEITGKNLFVNIGRLNDPNYSKIKKKFEITNLPVIIMTGIDEVASIEDGVYYSTAYVRLDNEKLLNSTDLTIKSLERLFNLFINQEIVQALKQAQKDGRNALVSYIKNEMSIVLKKLGRYLSERDIGVSLFEGKFELKKSGGTNT